MSFDKPLAAHTLEELQTRKENLQYMLGREKFQKRNCNWTTIRFLENRLKIVDRELELRCRIA